MIIRQRLPVAAALALCVCLTAGCESSANYGGSVSYGYAGGYYPGGYYPGYYPGYPCCWDDDIEIKPPDRPGDRPDRPDRPGDRPDRPTTLPAHPGELPSSRPSTRPAPTPRPQPAAARPAPRPTPRPMGGGGRRR